MKQRNFPFALLLVLGILPACSTFTRPARHSDPLAPAQHVQLGTSYEAQGLTDAAARQYEAALRLQKTYIPAHIAQGNLAFARGDVKTAEASYRNVLRLDRDHAGANNNLAMVYLTSGKDVEKAEQYAQTALKQNGPLRPYVLDTLASIHIRQGRPEEALKALDEADALAPSDHQALREQLAKTRETLAASVHSQ